MAPFTKELILRLSELGLSEYEAKAYLALIREHPATAYEIGKASGVPTSKVYEVLGRLLEKKLITTVEEGNRRDHPQRQGKRRYSPLQPEEFLNRYQSNITSVINSLKQDLESINGKRDVSYIWNITDREALLDKARRMIASAQHILLGSLWGEELKELLEPLRQAEGRGVQMALVHFGLPQISVGQIYHHPIEDTLYAEKGGRALVLVTDSRQVLMGTIGEGDHTEGAWSENRGFATIAEDYIKHDIYITKIIKRFDRDLIRTFGEKYAKLRDVLRDEDLINKERKD